MFAHDLFQYSIISYCKSIFGRFWIDCLIGWGVLFPFVGFEIEAPAQPIEYLFLVL